jgi:hypothetical protein
MAFKKLCEGICAIYERESGSASASGTPWTSILTALIGRVLINGSHSDTLSERSGHDPADKTGWIGRK